MSMTPRQLIEALSDCGILATDDAEELTRTYESNGDGEPAEATATDPGNPGELTQSLARQLIADGKATRFQVRAILAGASKGLRIGDYIVIDRIGSGGMGSVYKARHRVMKRIVALKLLPRAATNNPRLVQRFYREVEAAAALTHPNIVTAYDAGEFQGIHYLVSQFVDGLDLSQLVKKRGPLPLAAAVDYTVQAGRGLTYAHEHGVIHRDVKPGNLLLDREGKIKVLDMGLARFTEGDQTISEASLTVTGRLMGTVEYMSPEHAANPKNADHRSDIYSLGCTFYRLLTGKLPYKGETAVELIIAQREQPTPRLTDAVAGVPDAVQEVFERMLAKAPEDRYQTMAEAVDALAAAASATQLPPAAAPVLADFDHESDSQIDTKLDARGGTSLLGELAAANSGAFDPPPGSGSASGSGSATPEPLPAWPESTQPQPAGGIGVGALMVMLLVVVGAALGVIYLVARPAAPEPPPDPPVVVDPPKPVDPDPPTPDPPTPDPPVVIDPPDPVDPEPPLPPFEPLVAGEWRTLFDGEHLGRWEPIDTVDTAGGSPGEVTVEGRQILLKPGEPLSGVSWSGPMPAQDFEVTLEAKVDDAELLSIAFPIGTDRAAVQLDANNRRAGLFSIDGTGLRDDPMAAPFDGAVAGWHQLRIRVTQDHVQAWLNAQPITDQARSGSTFGAPDGYLPLHDLSIFASRGAAALRNIRIRRIDPDDAPTRPDIPDKPDTPPDTIATVLEPSTEWHDMLPSIDVKRDARGDVAVWTRKGDTIVGSSNEPRDLPRNALLVPAQISGSYQLRFDVKVESGFGPLVVTLPVEGKRLHLVLDGPTGSQFVASRAEAVQRERGRGFTERTIPVGGPHAVFIRVAVNDGRVTAAAKVNGRSVPGWTGTLEDLPALMRPGGGEPRGAARSAVTLRIAAREVTIDRLQLQILQGGRAELIPVAADDHAAETIELPRPDQSTGGPSGADAERNPDDRSPPRPRDGGPPPRPRP